MACPKSSTRVSVRDLTPRAIHTLRYYAPHTYRALSEVRFACYSSGSQSFGYNDFELSAIITGFAAIVKHEICEMERSMRINLPVYFQRYGWAYEQIDASLWRTTFFTEREDEFDLYVMLSDEWVHFAVSPFVPPPQADCQPRLYEALLQLNLQMRLVTFAVDDDGDVNLTAELPTRNFSYPIFELTVDTLVAYTNALSYELARLATEPNFPSPVMLYP